MSQRIKESDLENLLARINRTAGEEEKPWALHADGKYHANIGTYVLSGAYGGWKLERLVTEGGGVTSISHGGYIPKRALYDQMLAFLSGMEAANS